MVRWHPREQAASSQLLASVCPFNSVTGRKDPDLQVTDPAVPGVPRAASNQNFFFACWSLLLKPQLAIYFLGSH